MIQASGVLYTRFSMDYGGGIEGDDSDDELLV